MNCQQRSSLSGKVRRWRGCLSGHCGPRMKYVPPPLAHHPPKPRPSSLFSYAPALFLFLIERDPTPSAQEPHTPESQEKSYPKRPPSCGSGQELTFQYSSPLVICFSLVSVKETLASSAVASVHLSSSGRD